MPIDPWSLLLSWGSKRGLDAAFNKVRSWFTKISPRGVLIIGPGGVGKSTLGKLFSEDQRTGTGEYVESVSTETYVLSDDPCVQIVVPPGQPHRMDATWDTVFADLRDGKFRGVILIFAYGHHTIGDLSYKNHKLYKKNKGFDAFLRDYFQDCRATEEDLYTKASEAIAQCDKPTWLLTLVTKQDLWWGERDAVEKYYASGCYSDVRGKCLGRKNTTQFRHETACVSLVIRNLMTGRDELLKSTTSGYDMTIQEKSLEKLLQVFEGLMEWEEKYG